MSALTLLLYGWVAVQSRDGVVRWALGARSGKVRSSQGDSRMSFEGSLRSEISTEDVDCC